MNYPNFEEEKKLWKKGYKFVVGLDEAGRGPLAGPVVAGAVIINPKHEMRNPKQYRISSLGIRDSKQLSEKQRERLFKFLTRHQDIRWGIGIVSEKIIDKINILEATKLAMQKAVENLKKDGWVHNSRYRAKSEPGVKVDFLLIDGNFRIKSNVPQKSIIKGDQKVVSISAASIIAKVTRDRIMKKIHKKYPQYNFAKHKGYPTKLHREMIKKFGICPIHRKSFYPISSM
ncbi:MAG: ribonuclease HII [Candidatus Staskawiczbacteria bacterium]|nr:ribonuclease HII [Candidatus Staskawiczbacteria bacterium]